VSAAYHASFSLDHERESEISMDSSERLSRFKGSLVAVVTPFNADGSIDYGAFAELVRLQEEGRTAGLFLLSVAGEGATLTDTEFDEFTAKVLSEKCSLPYLFTCTGRHTEDSLRRVRVAADHGADAAVLAVPAHMGPDQDQAARYFLDIADRSPIPIGIFNNPSRVVTDLDTATVDELLSHSNIVLHKDGSSRTGRIGEFMPRHPDVCFMADDAPDQDILVGPMVLGARGIASAGGNVLPREFAALSTPWDENTDLQAFRALYTKVWPVMRYLYSFRSPIGIKSVMNALGMPAGHLRAPLTPMSDEEVAVGLELIRSAGGIGS
jgi:4-hydroxy-tetrahydrodipicolinate synthase